MAINDASAWNGGAMIAQDPTLKQNQVTPQVQPNKAPDYLTPGQTVPTDAAPPTPTAPSAGGAATPIVNYGGAAPTLNTKDPNSVNAFISYYGNQPGVNPSVKNDPGYWAGVINSGSLGPDAGYIVQKFMTPEGAPAGSNVNFSNNPNLGGFAAGRAPTLGTSIVSASPGATLAPGLFATLAGRAGLSEDVNPNDPVIRDQVNAYEAIQQRGARSAQAQAAEQGGEHANVDAVARSMAEKAQQNTAGFQGQVMQQELIARRKIIQDALTGQQGLITADQQLQLQQELANNEMQLREYEFTQGQGQQESQFARQLAQGAFQFDTNSQFQNSPLYGA